MDEQPRDSFEERSHALFHDSVDGLDFAVRSRLTQARHAAVEAASANRRSWLFRFASWKPVAGVTAAPLGAQRIREPPEVVLDDRDPPESDAVRQLITRTAPRNRIPLGRGSWRTAVVAAFIS